MKRWSETAWHLLAGIILVAILWMLVKPGKNGHAPATQGIIVVTNTLADLISMAIHGPNTGGG